MSSDNKSRGFLRRLGRWGLYFLIFLGLVGVGRLIQVGYQSQYWGERDPYLQMQTPTAVTVRWQTRDAAQGVVRYGTAPGQLDQTAREPSAEKSHQVRLTGLSPDTRYYYSVGTAQKTLHGGAEGYWFQTAPKAGTVLPVRIWVIGDPGEPGGGADAVREAMLGWVKAHPRPGRPPLDLWFTTGDNAYRSGTNMQYQQAIFDPYKSLLHDIDIWPVYGNHDARRWAFFKVFDFPTKGEGGGVPSGSESYYSFDYANIHFVVLDSEDSDRSPGGPMLSWLKRDLAANHQTWLVALFHHPPYTKGSHDSDNPHDSRGRMVDMRRNALPILEAHGVDLVLSGHSHDYERSWLLDCHYGFSRSFKPSMVIENRSGNPDDGGPYTKRAAGPAPHEGTVYAVVGSSSKVNHGSFDHPALPMHQRELGSLMLDVVGKRLDAYFINSTGQVDDQFAIVKGDPAAPDTSGHCPG